MEIPELLLFVLQLVTPASVVETLSAAAGAAWMQRGGRWQAVARHRTGPIPG
jgi:hypothetical protein